MFFKILNVFGRQRIGLPLYSHSLPHNSTEFHRCCCGISKHSPFEIAPLFKEAVHIKNINLPLSFWDVLNGGIQARIKQIAEKESPSVPDFCQRTRLSFTILMNILFRKELPTIWMVQKILIAFPSINARWLLLGEGDMKLTKRNSFFTRINDFLHILFASK